MRGVLLALLCSAGCAKQVGVAYLTPESPALLPANLYPAEADYALLGLVTGTACGEVSDARRREPSPSPLEPGTGDPVLYQAAKYDALTKVEDADNLTSIRVKVEQTGDEQCVTVTGRAYRLLRVRSAPPAGGGSLPAAALGTAPTATSGARGAKIEQRNDARGGLLTLQVGLPGVHGVPLRVSGGRRGKVLGFDVGLHGDTNFEVVGPVAGITAGYGVGRFVFPYATARGGWSFGDREGLIVHVAAGVDAVFGRVGVRAEAGTLIQDGASTLVSIGPIVRM